MLIWKIISLLVTTIFSCKKGCKTYFWQTKKKSNRGKLCTIKHSCNSLLHCLAVSQHSFGIIIIILPWSYVALLVVCPQNWILKKVQVRQIISYLHQSAQIDWKTIPDWHLRTNTQVNAIFSIPYNTINVRFNHNLVIHINRDSKVRLN